MQIAVLQFNFDLSERAPLTGGSVMVRLHFQRVKLNFQASKLYDFLVTGIDGQRLDLNQFRDKVFHG